MKKYIFIIITTFASSILFNSCKKEKSVLAEAKFTFSGDLNAIPTQIQFTNNSFGISYVWDFGDGTSSNEKNPIHTYNEYGLYKVKLTAKGSNNIDTLVKDLLIGGNLGQIGGLICSNSTSTTKFKIGESYTDAIVSLPYTNGNGGVYNRLIINSTGVQGLTAKLSSGKFNSGDGNLEFLISGTPSSKGTAKFKIDLAGKSCELNVFVLDTAANFPTNGLVGWWPFNGNANDESGNGNNGNVLSGATFSSNRFGISNTAILSPGDDTKYSGVEIPVNISTSKDFSLSIWFRTADSTKINQTIFNTVQHTILGFGFNHIHTQGKISGYIGNGDGSWILLGPSNNWNPNDCYKWHNLVYIKNGNFCETYYDSKLVSNYGPVNLNVLITKLLIGTSDRSDNYAVFKGLLDDFGYWNRALTLKEITTLYNLK